MTTFGDFSALLEFLTTGRRGHPVIFLVGSGLTKPSPGTSTGVPGVDGFIKLVKEELEESPGALEKLEEILRLEPPSRRYREVFDHLGYRRNYDVANKLVRLAVLQARANPDNLDDAVIEGVEEACAALERDFDGWILNPAVAALGEIITQSPDQFGEVVLTTNLDPLIEVAIGKAGGRYYRTAVHSDTSLEDTVADGCRVVHLHGHWFGTDTLHTTEQLNQPRPKLEASLAHLLRNSNIFVALGYGGWDDIFMSALCGVLNESKASPDVRWAFLEENENEIRARYNHLFDRLHSGIQRGRIRFYKGIDLQKLLPKIASELQRVRFLRAMELEQEYREAVADHYRTERLLHKRIHIDTNYYPLKLQRITGGEEQSEIIDALTLFRAGTARRVCILGPSGAGKTTIIRRLLWESTGPGSPVPFVVSLRNHADTSLPEPIAVDSLLSCTFRSFQLDKNTLAQLSRLVANRKGLFIFDGFDELRSNPGQAYRIADAIETFFAGRPDCQVVITSRTQEDLHGKFTGFVWYNLMPIDKTEIDAFSSRLGFKIRNLSTLSGQLDKLFDLRPVLLLIAMLLAQKGTSLNKMGSIRSQFQLLEIALAELLLERRKEAPSRENVRPFSQENVFNIRMSILERIVQQWGISSLPCRLSKAQLEEYVSEAIRGVMREERSVSKEEISFLVPTGICLKLITEIGRPEEYCFVHNSIQEFLYAKSILQSVRSRKSDLLAREYYSAEIMQLLGEELTASDVDVLLSWARSPNVDLMTKKVSLGILGFAKRNANLSDLAHAELVKSLVRAFDEEKDLGVAGRIAEALRRLGHSQTTADFIKKLPEYPQRKEPRSVEEEFNRPVTFEIDHSIEGINDDLASELSEVHLRSANPLVRKHALIYLMRRTGSLPVHVVVRHCFSEYNRLAQASTSSVVQSRNVAEISRSLRYGFAALKRFGTSVEKDFVLHTKEGLERIIGIDEQTMQDLNETVTRVACADWLGNVPIAQEGPGSTIFLIRHGESNGNIERRFLGRSLPGELTDKGRSQADYTAKHLGKIVSCPPIVVASTMKRALETAGALESKLGWPIETEELFAEMDYGDWTGCLKEKIMARDSGRYEAWKSDPGKHPPPKGESFYEVRSRACSGFAKWYAEAVKNEVDLVIVSHLFPMSAIFEALTGDSLREPHNCSITRINRKENRWDVTALGLTDHLGESGLGSAFVG